MANTTIPEYNYIPKYIRQTVTNRPKDVITSARWNELFNLLIKQGDYTAEELGKILDYFTGTADIINTRLIAVEQRTADMSNVIEVEIMFDTDGNIVASKTFAQILEKVEAGKAILKTIPSEHYYLLYEKNPEHRLSFVALDSEPYFYDLRVFPDNTWHFGMDMVITGTSLSWFDYANKNFVRDNYVAKVTGKDLSTNDYTNEDKEKVSAAITDLSAYRTAFAQDAIDNDLQGQIDAIVSSSDVKDVVGTYEALLAYDTSTLGNKDIVKVLSDSLHDNARSYFRWVITNGVGSWWYIGSEAESYTKAESDILLARKLNKNLGAANAGKVLVVNEHGEIVSAELPPTIPEAPTDGKQYARKNGAWAEVTGGGGAATVFYVNITQSGANFVSDKSTAEIYAAYENNTPVFAKVHFDEDVAAVLPAYIVLPDAAEFGAFDADSENGAIKVSVQSDGVFVHNISLQGPQGIQGPQGPKGETGSAGHTPVKGTDYWTASDKQSIVNDVLAALPTWQGGSY